MSDNSAASLLIVSNSSSHYCWDRGESWRVVRGVYEMLRGFIATHSTSNYPSCEVAYNLPVPGIRQPEIRTRRSQLDRSTRASTLRASYIRPTLRLSAIHDTSNSLFFFVARVDLESRGESWGKNTVFSL